MKPRLQTSLGQHLVLTPQLRQALHLLQLSALELEAEINAAVESNPLLDWDESEPLRVGDDSADAPAAEAVGDGEAKDAEFRDDDWGQSGEAWQESRGWQGDDDGDPVDRMVQTDSLHDHLAWQLNLGQLSVRDLRIGLMLIDAIDDDGYLRESLDAIAQSLLPEIQCTPDEILAVLRHVQRLDPVGVGARDLGECLVLQLDNLPDDTPGRTLARRIATDHIDRLPRIGIEGVAAELCCELERAEQALALLRSLDPRPGAQIGDLPANTYVTPDCVITRQQGMWRVTLANERQPRLTIHRGYEQMIQHAGSSDAGYLRGRLQEARWLLKNLAQRGETLLKVVQCLVREQSGFLEFGPQALRPLTLREVAAEVGLHESTISRSISRKYVRTPRGTIPLRAFFASGIGTEGGGEASSIAIQEMIKRLVEAENPRKPLSDARLAEMLKATGVPVARRTVAKYRELLSIPSSHERVRVA
ncbi:RNA polymerase factor sigma-54 [Luteimonas sp. 22616]|uniref:RNA polymerase factor sigma-54 n=1 Tax=Luteimonas sp. 22616 TaxID=3453951 RepID=UPI003F855598